MRSLRRVDSLPAEELLDERARAIESQPQPVSLQTLEARGKLALQEFHRQLALSARLAQQSLALVGRFSSNGAVDDAHAQGVFRDLLAREPVHALAAVE